MKKYIRFYSIFLLFIFLASCKSQDKTRLPIEERDQLENYLSNHHHTITELDTISLPNAPHRITRNIKKDKEGNLLFAAYEDIIRYDGESFTNFPKRTGLESFDAFDALEDKKGNIWIASTHFGVFRHDGKSLTHFTTDEGLAHNRVMCIYEDSAGNIWIGSQGGASCYDGTSFRNFTTKDGLTHNDINSIIEDKEGNIWFGTSGTICMYDPSSSLTVPGGMVITEIKNEQSVPITNVRSITQDEKGHIWIGSQNGLWRYNGLTFVNYTTESVGCVYEDEKGNIWISYTEGGLTRYDEKSLLKEHPTATQIFKGSKMLFGISEDKKGNIWVGTLNGVYRYDGNSVNYLIDLK